MDSSPTGPGPTAAEGPNAGPGPYRRPPVPRWVKVFAAVFIAVVVLLVAVAILSGGQHGPGRHMSAPASPSVSAALEA